MSNLERRAYIWLADEYARLVNEYGDGDSLHTFNLCADNALSLDNSTIDRIDRDGTCIVFWYNENNPTDYVPLEELEPTDLLNFLLDLGKILEKN